MRIPGGRTGIARLLTIAGIMLATAVPASAQGSIRHGGFFFGVGLGPGWAKYGGDASDGTTEIGFSGNLRLGGHLKPNLLLGGETNGWYKSSDGVNYSWGSIMGTIAVYPAKSAAFYLKGGAGYMLTSVSDDFDDIQSSHFGLQFGAGYDLKVGSGSALTIYANWVQGLSGALKLDDVEIGDVSPRIIQVGLGFSLY